MNVVIVGCGRVGATLAGDLDAKGHEVTIVDISTRAFERLPATFDGQRRPGRRDGRGHPAPGRRGRGATSSWR